MPSPATHLRAPLLWLLFPLMAGLGAAKLWPAPGGHLLPPALIAAVLGLASLSLAGRSGRWNHAGWALCLGTAGALGGFVMLHVREPQLHQWENQPPREITLTLRVQQIYPGAPQSRSFSGLGEIVSASDNDGPLIGRRVYFSAVRRISVTPQRSGLYVVRGVIEPLPPDLAEASFNDYLANLGIRQKLTRSRIMREVSPPGRFRQFCNRTENRLERILVRGLEHHPDVSSLYLAMLLGEKAVLSPDQQNAFMRTGTFHIFSISGLHVGIIAIALHSVLRLLQVPRRATVLLSLVILWLYLEVTGINSPALRSFLMIAFLLGTQIFRLPGNSLAALSAAALLTLLLDPMQLFSTGFQMSYAVVTALVVMGAPLTEKILVRWHPFSALPRPNWRKYHHFINWCGRSVLGACAAGWVAFLASAPSGIGYFNLFSPGSLLANLIVVPLSSLAIVGGFLSLLLGLVGVGPWSALFNAAAAVTIMIMDWLTQHGTRLPGIYFDAHFAHSWMAPVSLIAMTGVMLGGLAGRWSRRYGGYWPPVVLLTLILIFAVRFG